MRTLTYYLSILFFYGYGLFTGSIVRDLWYISFLQTGILSAGFLVLITLLSRKKRNTSKEDKNGN